ncbi:MAG: branched-chain amino acid transport system II carrier protein, partial [Bdellovibrionota bacterium]
MSKRSFFGGLAVFAMFFGSGNLIFPLIIGRDAREHWLISIFGLGISGVLLPLLGLIAMIFVKDGMEAFFGTVLNKFGAYIAALIILLLCGPLGVVPRCITVAEGAWHTFSPHSNNVFFVATCCAVVWCCVYFKTNLVDLIGKYFTPFKLISLLTIIFSSIFFAVKTNPTNILPPSTNASSSLMSGLINGYGTMDLFAAL